MHPQSQWIWADVPAQSDQYAEFYNAFDFNGGEAYLQISADSNYAVYLNGDLVDSGQYPDFPHSKVYDTLPLSGHCIPGKNHLAIIVWHYGESNMGYFPGNAALRYALFLNENLAACSGPETLSRISRAYQNGQKKIITRQLGFSFWYDLNQEDGWKTGNLSGFQKSRIVIQDLPMRPRPIQKVRIGAPIQMALVFQAESRHFLLDLGREEAGYLMLRIHSDCAQRIIIAYGEHIVDGGVRRIINSRDFSVEITLRPGMNEYMNPFRRLGCRYLEVFAQSPIRVETLTICPADYPLQEAPKPPLNNLQTRIYDIALRTLRLCMHDHYEDTPWREQALYAMDSRNQMLCGYYAFGEFSFPRANLQLIGQDDRQDGLLSICSPSIENLTIPSFSLHYFTAVWEYTQHSGDLTLAQDVYPKLESVLAVFIRHLEQDCLPIFTDACHWNFYEWSDGLSGSLHCTDQMRFDAALNFLFSLALQTMNRIANKLGVSSDYCILAQRVNQAARQRFYDETRGIFVNSSIDSRGSELVNALAILCGAAPDEKALAQKLAANTDDWTPATLSMTCFLYDALLKADRKAYAPFILADIDRKYEKMLDAGATSFWETEKGEADFDAAGSLCHGWSAMPIYYYHTLLKSSSN